MEYSPDGAFLAAGYDSKIVKVWKNKENLLLYTLSGHKDIVTDITFSPDNKYLASGSMDNSVIIWDLMTGNQVDQIKLWNI